MIGLSSKGEKLSYENSASKLTENSCLIIGGFQKGQFSDAVQNRIDQLISIDDSSHEAHVVVSRMLYEYEKTIFM